MTVPFMVGICGGSWENSNVGKTTVANILVKHMDFYPVSFIDPVKEVARKFFNWQGKKEHEDRVLLDQICRMGRSISEDYWRDLTLAKIHAETQKDKIVFDDVWFANEVKMIVDNKGIVLRVTKKGYDSPVLPCETLDIENDGSILDLQRRVTLMIADVLSSRS